MPATALTLAGTHPALWLATLAVDPSARLARPPRPARGFPRVAAAAAAAGSGSPALLGSLPVPAGTPAAPAPLLADGFPV